MSEHKQHVSSTTWSKVVLAAVMSKVALVSLLEYCHHCLTQHRFFYPRHQILTVQMIAATNAQQSSVVSHTLLPEDLSKTAINTAACNCSRGLDNSLSLSSILLVVLSLTLSLTLALPLTLVALILPLVLVLHHTGLLLVAVGHTLATPTLQHFQTIAWLPILKQQQKICVCQSHCCNIR